MSGRLWIIVVVAAAVGLALGAGVRHWWLAPADSTPGAAPTTEPGDDARTVVGEPRPGFSLPSLDGGTRAIGDYDGRVVLLNFWATWCPPCVEEVPALDALQDELGGRGLRVLGVALDEAEPVRAFAREHGVDYPLLTGGREAFDIAAAYGNGRGTLPYTVVIDREGIVRATHQGALTRDEAREMIRPWL